MVAFFCKFTCCCYLRIQISKLISSSSLENFSHPHDTKWENQILSHNLYSLPDTVLEIKSVEMKRSSIWHTRGLMINSYRIGGWEVNIIMGIEEIRCEYEPCSFDPG